MNVHNILMYYVHNEINRKQKMGILKIKRRVKKTFSCPQVPMTFDTFPEILKLLNRLQNSSYNTLNPFKYALNARDFAGVF